MDNNSIIAKNSVLLGVRMAIVMLITIFTTRLLLEGLGINDYGIYNVTIGVIAICSFLQPAMANGIQRFFNFEIGKSDYEKANRVFNTGFQIQIIVALIIVLFCETIGLWYVVNKLVVPEERYNATLIIYQVSILGFVFSLIQVPFMAAIMAHEKMDFFAFVSIADAILKFIVSYVIKYFGSDHLVLYSFFLLGINVANFIVYVFYSIKKFPEIRLKLKVYHELFRPMLTFSGWNLLEKIARVGKEQGINVLLNFYFGPVVNAARGIVNQVSYAFTSMVDSTVTASRPQSIQAYARGEYRRTLNIMFSLSKFTFIMMYILIYPVYLEAPYILHLWLGNNVPDLTLPFLNVVLLTIIVDKLAAPISVVVHATGKMRIFNIVSGVLNIMTIPFAIIALAVGADAITVYWIIFICTVIAQIAFVIVLKHLVDYSVSEYIFNVFYPSAIVIIASFLFPYMAHSYLLEGLFRLVVVLIISLSSGGLATYFLGLTGKEKQICRKMVLNLGR